MMQRAANILGLSLALASCATVRSDPPAKSADVMRGVSYFLPRREIKITAERRILKLEDAQKKVAAATKALETATTEDTDAGKALKQQEALLATLAAGTKAWQAAEAARATAAGTKLLKAAALDKAKAALDLANAELLRITGSGGACVATYDSKLELLPAVADHDWRFSARFAHNILRDDDGKLGVTADGLLSSSNVVAADRTGDIIVELAGAIAGFGGFGGTPAGLLGAKKSDVAPNCDQPVKKFVYQFDPLTFDPDIPPGVPGPNHVNALLQKAGFDLEIELRNAGQRGPACGVAGNCGNTAPFTTQGRDGALFYRSAVPVTVILKQGGDPVDAAVAMIPQLGPISYIPMRSSAFVKTVDDVTFSNGAITAWNASRPSEVLEIVRLPIKLLKAVISVPAEIISLKINVSDKEKGLAAAQQAQIAQQEKLVALKACITAAQAAGTSAEACLPK
jgi:hypothetical protein